MLVLPTQGEVAMLTAFFAQAMTVRLYSNDYTPVQGTTEAQVTEVVGGGYAAKVVAGGSWTITPGDPSQAVNAEQIWTFTGAAPSSYGYYVTRNSDNKLMFAERFPDGPYPIANNGDQTKVTPTFTQQ